MNNDLDSDHNFSWGDLQLSQEKLFPSKSEIQVKVIKSQFLITRSNSVLYQYMPLKVKVRIELGVNLLHYDFSVFARKENTEYPRRQIG